MMKVHEAPPAEAANYGNHGCAIVERVETSKGKTILHPMKLDFPENAVTAILGPSGSGTSVHDVTS